MDARNHKVAPVGEKILTRLGATGRNNRKLPCLNSYNYLSGIGFSNNQHMGKQSEIMLDRGVPLW
jgi:hypothetical protein